MCRRCRLRPVGPRIGRLTTPTAILATASSRLVDSSSLRNICQSCRNQDIEGLNRRLGVWGWHAHCIFINKHVRNHVHRAIIRYSSLVCTFLWKSLLITSSDEGIQVLPTTASMFYLHTHPKVSNLNARLRRLFGSKALIVGISSCVRLYATFVCVCFKLKLTQGSCRGKGK